MADEVYVEDLTMADFKVWAKRWCCRWCRSKAERIIDIEHEEWCQIFKRTGCMKNLTP